MPKNYNLSLNEEQKKIIHATMMDITYLTQILGMYSLSLSELQASSW